MSYRTALSLIIPAFSNSPMLRKDKSNRLPLDVVMTRQGRKHAATLIVPRIDFVVQGESSISSCRCRYDDASHSSGRPVYIFVYHDSYKVK